MKLSIRQETQIFTFRCIRYRGYLAETCALVNHKTVRESGGLFH